MTMKKRRNMIKKYLILFITVLMFLAVSACTNNSDSQNATDSSASQTSSAINKWTGTEQEPTTIILVRHGETDYNIEGRYQGRLDIPLNETGLEQADQLAEYLKDTAIDAVVTSPLQRANVTGQKVAELHGLSVSTDERLAEIDYGDWAGCYKKDLKAKFPDDYKIWEETPWLFTMPNGENLEMLGTRGAEAIYEIACNNAGKTVLIAAHSTFNQAVLCELLGLGYEHVNQVAQDNTSISVLRYDGTWKILVWNAIPHRGMLADGLPLQ